MSLFLSVMLHYRLKKHMLRRMYIDPVLHSHTTFAAAKTFLDTYGPLYDWSKQETVGVKDILQAKRNLIIGEPGVGKTTLLEQIRHQLEEDHTTPHAIIPIALKADKALIELNNALTNTTATDLLLDGLDEVKASRFPAVLEKINSIANQRPEVAIYVSARYIFATRYATAFNGYRIITVSPFTLEKVREYLIASNYPPADVDTFLARISFSHTMLVVQTPRYLILLDEYLREKGLNTINRVSRSDLFDYFIDEKLGLEAERLNIDKATLTKRLLEKLALTMELYQTNTIKDDELITFLDDLDSDIKLAPLTQPDLQDLVNRSLLKNDHDAIEFDNTEFQEYLAAKEITRFPDFRRAAFTFAVDEQLNTIYPSWFNTLTFLVDKKPELLEQLIEFSGIRGEKVID